MWNALSEEAIAGFRDDGGLLIGKSMAFKMGVNVGDTVTLTSARGEATAFGTLPTRRTYRIAGIFDVGMHEYDSSFVFMPLGVAGKFFGLARARLGAGNLHQLPRSRSPVLRDCYCRQDLAPGAARLSTGWSATAPSSMRCGSSAMSCS